MDNSEQTLNKPPTAMEKVKAQMAKLGPAAFGFLAFFTAVGSFATGGYISLGQEGLVELAGKLRTEPDPALRPTHEWIEIEKTIYQLDRREDAKYVLAKFTLRAPIDSAEEVRRRLPEVEFALQTYIRELSSRELQGAMGLYNLRNACLFRARRILGRDAVDDILIGELLVE
ncbi:flagellar basal body-associated FliL family protein [Parvularcula sp. BGMRC 0090]|uniref:Flagellar protein FliL n=2 Tax=Parvularcula maris TaxID=2965077 RepID=A0A9X2RK89_9PROT|nr:flagellar basal body-associated FliL family protein [Parvularcula maris]